MLDRVRRREVSLRAAHDDRLAGGDLPLDVRHDQPEPGRREAAGACGPPVEDRARGGEAERGPARHLQANPRVDAGDPRAHDEGDEPSEQPCRVTWYTTWPRPFSIGSTRTPLP